MISLKKELDIWRLISNFWGIATAIFFFMVFFHIVELGAALKTLSAIYIGILSIFITTKEFSRWTDKGFLSDHHGELFVVVWTILMVIFISLNVANSIKYPISGEFTATYLSILGIFAISRQSRHLKRMKNKSKK